MLRVERLNSFRSETRILFWVHVSSSLQHMVCLHGMAADKAGAAVTMYSKVYVEGRPSLLESEKLCDWADTV